ncbi:hypothetical protein GWE18_17520 [Bradyrhizobium sp. CSA112]|uniref:hypothetical protein n=1 Tax=Bradyrhizobium sp. CSA112 TaxID=2699170 RepID=UPI0023AEE1D3|nr:hypothetical protein [Bradyrhizobium sp. CSA112]MDE5454608.1 hypothetical protein [Bradyrhizobium sp. CSA112]
MERAVDVVHADRAYISAVRIKEGGGRASRYWVPFNYGRTTYAWPLGSRAVLAIGGARGEIAVYDLAGGTTTMRTEINSSASAFLSSDEAWLYVYNSWTLEIWSVDTLTRLTVYDSIVTGPDGTIRLADGQLWANEAKLAPGEDVWRLHIHHDHHGFDAAVEHTDGRLLVVTYDDELHRPSGILIVDPAAATAEWRPRSGLVKRSSWIGRLFGSRASDPGLEEALRQRFAVAEECSTSGRRRPTLDIKDPQAEIIVDRFITNRVELPDLSAESVTACLDDMAGKIERQGLRSMIRAEELDFTFEVGGRTVREREFFDILVERRMTQALPALRRLLTVYHAGFEGGEGSQPRNEYLREQPTGGLAHAMRALLLLDRGSTDIFRTYIAKRDGEHEEYATRTLYPEFVARNGMTTEDDIRLAVAVALNITWGGLHGRVWHEHDLIGIAKSRFGADRFAAIVTDEVKALDLEPQWDVQDSQGGYYLGTLLDEVPASDPFGQDLRQALARLWPSFADAITSHTGRQ